MPRVASPIDVCEGFEVMLEITSFDISARENLQQRMGRKIVRKFGLVSKQQLIRR